MKKLRSAPPPEGFTLAEVLITLGIIGVVSALTIPTLISNHKKHVIETKLAKYYTNVNQAFLLSEVENGPRNSWDYSLNSQDFYETYLARYLNAVKTDKPVDKRFLTVYFADGTKASMGYTRCFNFYPKASTQTPNACANYDAENKLAKYGKDQFNFIICNQNASRKFESSTELCGEQQPNHVPTGYETMYNDCKNINSGIRCTDLIEINGWKIPKDYPIKI